VREDLVGGLARREHELIEEIVAAVAERDLLEVDAEARRDGPSQREPSRIGIEVELRQYRGQRGERFR
jgi:hypothetical protein